MIRYHVPTRTATPDTFSRLAKPGSLVVSCYVDYPDDPEMAGKLEARRRVFEGCEFVSEPHDLAGTVLGALNSREPPAVWVDSVAIWISNLMMRANTRWEIRSRLARRIVTDLKSLTEAAEVLPDLNLVGDDVDYDYSATSDSASLYQYLLHKANRLMYMSSKVKVTWHTGGQVLSYRKGV